MNAACYRRLFGELRQHESDIAQYTSASLAPYVPAGTQLDRRVSFFFNDLADGWARGSRTLTSAADRVLARAAGSY